jgi:hypothetical protein
VADHYPARVKVTELRDGDVIDLREQVSKYPLMNGNDPVGDVSSSPVRCVLVRLTRDPAPNQVVVITDQASIVVPEDELVLQLSPAAP